MYGCGYLVHRSFRGNKRAAERSTQRMHLSMDATLSYARIAVKDATLPPGRRSQDDIVRERRLRCNRSQEAQFEGAGSDAGSAEARCRLSLRRLP